MSFSTANIIPKSGVPIPWPGSTEPRTSPIFFCPQVVSGNPDRLKDLVLFINESIQKHVTLSEDAMQGANLLKVTIGDELINKNIMFWNDETKQYELAQVTKYNPSTSYFTLGKPTIRENIPS